MATISRKAYSQALTSGLATELNALAIAAYTAASAAIDNHVNLDLYADFLLSVTFGTAPTAGKTVDLYLIPSPDGTTYVDGGGAVAPASALKVGSFQVRNVATAQEIAIFNILVPEYFKLVALNNTDQAMAATGNTVQYRTFSLQSA